MKHLAPIFAVVPLALSLSAGPCPGQEAGAEFYWGDVLDQGAAWLEENTTLDLDATVEALTSAEDVGTVLEGALEALGADSYEMLADFEPQVRWALGQLDQIEGGEPYADWLRQRLDFFEAAEVYTQPAARPTPPPRTAPPAATPAVPPPAATRRPEPAEVVRPAPHAVEVWTAKLAKRTRPARAEALVPRLKTIFREEGVPPALVWLAEVESSFNPRARSPVGAAGLYQLMPATARSLGVSVAPRDERLDAEKNARAAARYLKRLHDRFGSWDLALAAYNGGQGRVSRLMRQSGGHTFDDIATLLPSETRMYVPKVIATVQLREKVDLRRI